jgi:hypothetical protein
MRNVVRQVLLLGALLCGLWVAGPSTASAATLDSHGFYVGVAMDRAGNAHAVWRKNPFTPEQSIGYCAIPRGSSACGARATLLPPEDARGGSTRAPYVFVAANGDIVVVESRSGQSPFNMNTRPFRVFAWRSTDGGHSFAPPVEIGSVDLYNREAAEYAPNDRILLVNDFANRENVFFQSAPAGGPPVETAALVHSPAQRNGYTSVGYSDERPVVVVADGINMSSRAFSGSGDPNDEASWAPETRIVRRTQSALPPSLASGPHGLVLAYGDDHGHTALRKFNGTRFGAAHVIHRGDGGDIFEDSGGRFYVSLHRRRTGNAAAYSTSSNGTNWSRPRPMPGVASVVRIAAAPGRGAIAVWNVATGAAGGPVKAARFAR